MNRDNHLGFYLQLSLLGSIWGASFLFMRIATPEFGPFSLVFIRCGVAAIFLSPLLLLGKEFKLVLARWWTFIWLGATSVAIPFCLFAYATLHITAGSASVLNATTPMFSAVIAWIWLKEQLNIMTIAGLLLGFSGVFVLSLGRGGLSFNLLPIVAALCATCLYGYGSCYARKHFAGYKASTTAAGSQLGAAIILLPFGLLFWPDQMPSIKSWVSGILLAVFCTALALIMFFHLIKKEGVARTVSVTYLIPVFGILWGVIFLQEVVTIFMLLGGGLVLAGVALTGIKKTSSKIR